MDHEQNSMELLRKLVRCSKPNGTTYTMVLGLMVMLPIGWLGAGVRLVIQQTKFLHVCSDSGCGGECCTWWQDISSESYQLIIVLQCPLQCPDAKSTAEQSKFSPMVCPKDSLFSMLWNTVICKDSAWSGRFFETSGISKSSLINLQCLLNCIEDFPCRPHFAKRSNLPKPVNWEKRNINLVCIKPRGSHPSLFIKRGMLKAKIDSWLVFC